MTREGLGMNRYSVLTLSLNKYANPPRKHYPHEFHMLTLLEKYSAKVIDSPASF